jgi:hypothetical protein
MIISRTTNLAAKYQIFDFSLLITWSVFSFVPLASLGSKLVDIPVTLAFLMSSCIAKAGLGRLWPFSASLSSAFRAASKNDFSS